MIGSFPEYAIAETEVSKIEFVVLLAQQLAGSYFNTLTFSTAYK